MNYVLLTVVLFLTGTLLLPVLTRTLVNDVFNFLISPARLCLEYTTSFVGGFKDRAKRILNSGGIHSEFTQRAIGSSIVFLISVAALLADLDIVVLTLQAIGLVSADAGFSIMQALGMALSAGELIAVAIIASASAWGIILLDTLKITKLLPNYLFEQDKKIFNAIVIVISILMLIMALVILVTLAFVRWDALNFIPTGSELPAIGNDILSIFIGTSVLSFMTSLLLFIMIIPFLLSLIIILLAIILLPVFIIHLLLRIFHQLITLGFNIALALINLLVGLSAGLRAAVHKTGAVVDAIPEANPVPNNPENNNNNGGDHQPAIKPLEINVELGNLTGNHALHSGDGPTEISLSQLVHGGQPPYKYQLSIINPELVKGQVNGVQMILTSIKAGQTDASITVTDTFNNKLVYNFIIEVRNPPKPEKEPEVPHNEDAVSAEDDDGFNPLKII